ncbi:TfoX/Sxy family DNA transformation protein [Paracoccus sp. p4-l81]|uniref:TfoX/Sxy family DNA transformation protein n=1 Tax=unclassified Paracoccus (in: a-proteobacteria) TaxID=2688777 RepID=UPI0035B8AEE5
MDETDPALASLIALRSIGPATAQAMRRGGVRDADHLRELGADEAYRRMLIGGERPHFIGYYVLHMALQGRPWNDCQGAEKVALRARFDALKADMAKGRDGNTAAPFEDILNRIGLIRP